MPNGKDSKFGDYFNSKDIYLISIIADGIHQNHTLCELVKSFFKLRELPYSNIYLDKYIYSKQIISSYFFN